MIINGKFSDINIMFEEFKTQCPWLNNINEGCLSSEFFLWLTILIVKMRNFTKLGRSGKKKLD